MSCQQVSRLITTATTSGSSEDQDPYVFTETVPTTPPILFNAQKSRSRLYVDTQAIITPTPTPTATVITTPIITTPTTASLTLVTAAAAANKRPKTPTATANAKLKLNKKLPLGPLNGNNTKTQAVSTLAAATGHNGPTAAGTAKAGSPITVKTTNTQSQKQLQQKKALNVCIVRPQQQKQQLTPTVRQPQHYKVHQRKQASSPPPLLQHTPSLWQTPLLLDPASAVVSPSTSPASLPYPPVVTALTPTQAPSPIAAATAMVSPLITVSATTLPPSKFHHNTLAQHLQKVECIKKPKKSIPGIDSNTGKLTEQFQSQQSIPELQAVLKQHQPQQQQQQQLQRQEICAKTVIVQPTSAQLQAHANQQHQVQAQMHKPMIATSSAPPPLQAIQAVSPPQHSDSDLNEIPVNVIFRKPQTSEILHSHLGGSVSVTALGNAASRSSSSCEISNNTMVNGRSSVVEAATKGSANMKAKNVKIITSNMLSKPMPATAVVTETPTLSPPSLQPAPHVLRDIVFTHNGTAKIAPSNDNLTLPAHTNNAPHYHSPAPTTPKQQQNMSSMAKPPSSPQPLKYVTTTPIQFVQKSATGVKNVRAEEKCTQKITDTPKVMDAVKPTTSAAKNAAKRKTSGTPTALLKSNSALTPYVKKRSRKMGPLHSAFDNQMVASGSALIESRSFGKNQRNCHAMAVVKMSTAEIEADTTLLASATVLPYCIQKHWMYITREIQLVGGVGVVATADGKSIRNLDTLLTPTSERESRITQRKILLRRQALQLLSTHSLQKLPLQAAKRRLMCVDRLLRKYERHGVDDIIAQKKCNFVGCNKNVLELAVQCEDHIVDNISQHIFLPCTAKLANNTQCRVPVFDIMHDLPLCQEHACKRVVYNHAWHDQKRLGNHQLSDVAIATTISQSSLDCDAGDLLLQLQQIQHQHKHQHQQQQQQTHAQRNLYSAVALGKSKKSTNVKVTAPRKRKAPNAPTANTVGRPQKRPRKVGLNTGAPTVPIVAATVAPLQLTSAVLQRKSSTTSLESIASNSQSSNSQPHYISSNMNVQPQSKIAMPALAPLSGRNAPLVSSTVSPVPVPKRNYNFGNFSGTDNVATLAASDVMSQDLKPHEINQLVAQFSVAVNSNSSNHNHNNNNENSNSYNAYSNSSINNCYNYISTNCDSNFTSALGSSSSLPSSTEELFRQELLSVCENSSVYASSEDTGLGGLSETELMVGPTDADDIPLGDTRLLEEHDLANVLSALPEDAFNEIFTAVHQDEREEVERALELADKHLKSLQQTIGSDIDFLGDFPDDDEILADTNAMCSKMDIVSSVMRSPDATSGIDTSTLFNDSASNSGGGGGGSVNSNNIIDIRGLVQT